MMTSRAGDDGDAPLELRGGRGADGGGQGVIIFHQKTPARIRDAFTRSCSSSVCVFIFPFDLWVKKKKKNLFLHIHTPRQMCTGVNPGPRLTSPSSAPPSSASTATTRRRWQGCSRTWANRKTLLFLLLPPSYLDQEWGENDDVSSRRKNQRGTVHD